MYMRVDVVIVAYQNQVTLDACLDSVLEQPEVATITVIDHGPEPSSVKERPGVVTLHDPSNPGFGAGQNRGARVGCAQMLLLLNPDAWLAPAVLANALSLLAEDPSIAALQGAIANNETGELERSAGRMLGPIHLAGRALHLVGLLRFAPVRALARRVPATNDHVERRQDVNRAVESLAATAVLVRRTAFEQVGGFDEDYFLYGEDLDLCRRFRSAGWTLVALPETWATHASGGSAQSTWDREFNWWQGTLQYAKRWWSKPRYAIGMCAALLEVVVLAARQPRRTARALTLLRPAPITRARTVSTRISSHS